MNEYKDDLTGFVEWTPNRQVLVFRRTFSDRTLVRMRVFNRHLTREFWYPSPRSFHVNETCAQDLGEALSCAGRNEAYGEPPEWWAEFEAQYQPQGRNYVAAWKRGPKEK